MHEGDLYSALPDALRGRVDVLVANAPYVPTDSIGMMPPEARLHEPRVALDGGSDGLDVQRRIAGEAPLWLAPGGRLLIETSVRQAATTAALFEDAGLSARVVHSGEFDATVVLGKQRAIHRK
ncbi:release factor glutamine methyltransferase [Arthrobacter sp. Hiyo1]|nr:release factor glutamine methyltransferase [Arthrobacter sp. Hiyo1]